MRLQLVAALMVSLAAPAAAQELRPRAEQRAQDAQSQLESRRRAIQASRLERQDALTQALQAEAEAEATLARLEAELASLQGQLSRPGESLEIRTRRLDAMEADLRRFAGASTAEPLTAALDRAMTDRRRRLDRRLEVTAAEETVVSRQGLEVRAPVLRVGSVMTLVGGAQSETLGFIDRDGEANERVAGVDIPPGVVSEFRAAADGELSAVPLDVDGSLARSAGRIRRSFGERLEAGGFFIWPILGVGLLGLLLLLERAWVLGRGHVPSARVRRILEAVSEGRYPAVQSGLTGNTGFERVAAAGLSGLSASPAEREAVLETALLVEEPPLSRSTSLIAACAAIAPLLGLLGTVTGMIATFEVITVHGTGNPKLLSEGISVALVTTQFGLMVAVPLLLGHAVVLRASQRQGSNLEALRSAFLETVDEDVDVDETGASPRTTRPSKPQAPRMSQVKASQGGTA